MGLGVAVWAIPVVFVAFVLRTVAVLALRPRWPHAAEEIDRWWMWAPFVLGVALFVVLLVILTINVPLLGIVVAIGFAFAVYRGLFSASSVGSPFRPRRR